MQTHYIPTSQFDNIFFSFKDLSINFVHQKNDLEHIFKKQRMHIEYGDTGEELEKDTRETMKWA